VQARDRRIWALVERQHGVVAHGQLVELGLSRSSIRWRVTSGRLHPVRRGVYAVGRPELSPYGHWMSAVLACGPEPMLRAIAHRHPGAQLAWEAPMACGYGACYGCVVEIRGRLRRLCVEGPVLPAAAVAAAEVAA